MGSQEEPIGRLGSYGEPMGRPGSYGEPMRGLGASGPRPGPPGPRSDLAWAPGVAARVSWAGRSGPVWALLGHQGGGGQGGSPPLSPQAWAPPQPVSWAPWAPNPPSQALKRTCPGVSQTCRLRSYTATNAPQTIFSRSCAGERAHTVPERRGPAGARTAIKIPENNF